MSGSAGPKISSEHENQFARLAEAKQLDENKHMALDDWISQVVV